MKISLRRRHALTVVDGAFSHKIDFVTIFKEILNPKGHPNRITGSKVTAILLNGWILPIGGASSGRVCSCSLRSRLVLHPSYKFHLYIKPLFVDRADDEALPEGKFELPPPTRVFLLRRNLFKWFL